MFWIKDICDIDSHWVPAFRFGNARPCCFNVSLCAISLSLYGYFCETCEHDYWFASCPLCRFNCDITSSAQTWNLQFSVFSLITKIIFIGQKWQTNRRVQKLGNSYFIGMCHSLRSVTHVCEEVCVGIVLDVNCFEFCLAVAYISYIWTFQKYICSKVKHIESVCHISDIWIYYF